MSVWMDVISFSLNGIRRRRVMAFSMYLTLEEDDGSADDWSGQNMVSQ